MQMSSSVSIDRQLCAGYGNCVVVAPEIFDLDPDTSQAIVRDQAPVEAHQDAIHEAEADCPARAILLSRPLRRLLRIRHIR
jgi:ferredoxin